MATGHHELKMIVEKATSRTLRTRRRYAVFVTVRRYPAFNSDIAVLDPYESDATRQHHHGLLSGAEAVLDREQPLSLGQPCPATPQPRSPAAPGLPHSDR
jgi:hypothetical protein